MSGARQDPDARRRFGHPQDMDTGECTESGVCAAVDVHYMSTGGARALNQRAQLTGLYARLHA
jgi:hypothetical protein